MSLSKTPRSFSVNSKKETLNSKELNIKINFLIRNSKNDLHKIENAEFFKVSKPVGKLYQLLRMTVNFKMNISLKQNSYDNLYNKNTAKEIKKIIFNYLKERKDIKIKNLKKNKNVISYEYLHTIITIEIVSDKGIVSIFILRELN